MEVKRPVVIISLDNVDSMNVLAGLLWLKGCDVYKSSTADDCLAQVKSLESKGDVIVLGAEVALDRNAMLIMNVKRMNMNTKILAIGDEGSDKTRILDYGADEFALKPLSPENVADKVLMLLARVTIAENRSSDQT